MPPKRSSAAVTAAEDLFGPGDVQRHGQGTLARRAFGWARVAPSGAASGGHVR
ncbi:hypothetical protein [Streptomyces sp. V4I2]|uniref:hypothetical protein n=1 Tax=Streptomyces sp. V4I2 TaxID=3042280 RepID=UPI00278973C8|nr:hypothetical protein [Streptomyces sp. V4I2]MDQ1042398.1 hypothetical protein [Streptomyces sp. V4I2]